jgi:hypothetical protein
MNTAMTRVRRLSAVVATLAAGGLLTVSTPADAASRDADRDGMPNAWEIRHDLNPHKANARGDADQDGLRNLGEFKLSTDPQDEDTDEDGLEDGDEDSDDDGTVNDEDSDDQGEDCDDQGEDDDEVDDDRASVTYVVS